MEAAPMLQPVTTERAHFTERTAKQEASTEFRMSTPKPIYLDRYHFGIMAFISVFTLICALLYANKRIAKSAYPTLQGVQ